MIQNTDIVTLSKLWEKTKNDLKNDFNYDALIYESFIVPSKFSMLINNTLYIITVSTFAKDILNNKYVYPIEKVVNNVFNANFKVKFIVKEEEKILKLTNNADYIIKSGKIIGVQESLTFDILVVGNFNKEAVEAAKMTLDENKKKWNVLFIFGDTGLGKSHILSALGNAYYKKYGNKNVKLIVPDQFTKEMYDALTRGNEEIEKFKEDYDNIDLLLIDDVQLLTKRDKTNEILFSIINNFIKNNKTVVIVSDKNPEKLEGFDPRMKSRFSMGLEIKINKPEKEIIAKIIEQKIFTKYNTLSLSPKAIEFISDLYKDDIRKLEGAISKIYFYAINNLATNQVISDVICKKIFINNNLFNESSITPSNNAIIEAICLHYGVSIDLIKSNSRVANIVKIRQICMYLLREKTKLTLNQIGAEFNGKDHSTVMTAIKKVNKLIKTNDEYKKVIETLIKLI